MRIRKNRKITPLLFPEVEKPQPHICQLNKAPWDVICDWDEPIRTPSSPLHELFVVGDDNKLTGGNGKSLGDSIEVRESVSSMEKPEVIAFDDNYDTQPVLNKSGDSEIELIGLEAGDKTIVWPAGGNSGVPTPGPTPVPGPVISWRGRRIARGHLAWRGPRSSVVGERPVIWRGGRGSGERSMVWRGGRGIAWRGGRGGRGGAMRGRGRGFSIDDAGGVSSKRVTSSSHLTRVKKDNPYEYYYYSGFGPLWGKRRGEKVKGGSFVGTEEPAESNKIHLGIDESDAHVNNVAAAVGITNSDNNSISSSSSSRYELRNNDVLIDYVDDDFDDDDENDDDEDNEDGDSGEKIAKKRVRKPVKARSLKSLM